MRTPALSKEKLFAYLIVDDIQLEDEIVNKAKDNDAETLSKIADIYYDKEDYSKAMDWYRLAAGENNAHSQNRIGWMYQHGESVSVEYKLAMEWYLKAHNIGNIRATNSIGFLYSCGYGVNQDHKTALKWFLEAANKGNETAQNNVGIYYEKGYGVKIDIQYALEWYEKSAENGYEGAKNNIARLNSEGIYIDEKQKRYLQIEKDIKEHKEKNKSLENKLNMAEEKLQEANQKQKENENEIRILKQEIQVLKLESSIRKNEQLKLNPDRCNADQLITQISELIIKWKNSNSADNEGTQEEDRNNDLCYDK